MATMIKGLQYFPLSVDFLENDKILLIISDFGMASSAVILKLLCKIYKNSFYIDWDDRICKVFSCTFPSGFSSEEIQKIVDSLLKEGIFDKDLYNKYHILTSEEIQVCFFTAITKRRNKSVDNPEYLTEKVRKMYCGEQKHKNVPQSEENAPQNAKIVPQNEQSKVKESKVKESIVKESKVKFLNERESARAYEENSSENSSNNENPVSEVSMQPIDKINAIEAKMYGKSKYENWRQEMLKDNDWLSHVCRSSGKGTRAVDKLELVMNMFESHIISVGEEHTLEKINDYKRRFIYWWRSEKFAPYESLVNRSDENIGKSGRKGKLEYNEETLAEIRRLNREVLRERQEEERRKREREQNYAIR